MEVIQGGRAKAVPTGGLISACRKADAIHRSLRLFPNRDIHLPAATAHEFGAAEQTVFFQGYMLTKICIGYYLCGNAASCGAVGKQYSRYWLLSCLITGATISITSRAIPAILAVFEK